MSTSYDRQERAFWCCVPVLVLLLGCGASLLSPAALADVLAVLTAWTCLSFPLAVLVGHCALGEE
jgi:hypothetical protein